MYIPSDEAEILGFELYTGKLIARLRGMEKDRVCRVTCLAGRKQHDVLLHYHCRSDSQEIYSGAVDAEIGIWESDLLNRPVVPGHADDATIKG